MPLNIFTQALNNVPNEYFGKTERLFTYELYHELRGLQHFLVHPNIVIDAELPKQRISLTEEQELNLLSLDNLMSPDIIIHERESADQQLLVSEIKAEKYLSAEKMFKDLNKLIALRHNYRFDVGVFVAINVDMQKIKDYIHNLNQNNLQIMWPQGFVDNQLDIHIYTKVDVNSQWESDTLINIINNPPVHNP